MIIVEAALGGSLLALVVGSLSALFAGLSLGHCDTTGGPIIPEARAALEKGDVTPVLKWVKQADEAQIRAAFSLAVAVRGNGPEARELADRHFLETLIRIHRAGEGAGFSGIKDTPVEPIVAMADAALATGSADEMIGKLSAHLAKAIRERLDKAAEAAKTKDASVEAGREYVEAYVGYVHYIESVHAAMAAEGGHHH
jgi:hypothetical protein